MQLDSSRCMGAQRVYLDAMEELRRFLNSKLCFGLADFRSYMEIHLPGSFSRKHLDRVKTNGGHHITSILYLNNNWSNIDGGQLRIYSDADSKNTFQDIFPIEGRLVTFLSTKYPYEIISSMRNLSCITGFFKTGDPVGTVTRSGKYWLRNIQSYRATSNVLGANPGSIFNTLPVKQARLIKPSVDTHTTR